MTNVRRDREATTTLADLLEGQFDILVLTEVPLDLSADDLAELFDGTVLHLTDASEPLGSRLAIVTRNIQAPLSVSKHVLPQARSRPRAILHMFPETADAALPQLVAVHPIWPILPAQMAARDDYLMKASERVRGTDDFIIIGDFNLTPWEPRFDRLAGQRAGNPRWIRTWNARDPINRLTIDHALIGPGLELIQSDVLPDVGSDHYPIRLTVRKRSHSEE